MYGTPVAKSNKINMEKKPTKKEIELVTEWLSGKISQQGLGNKLNKSTVGALSTIARVYKHTYEN